MSLNIEQTIRGYLPQIIHMSLATCVNNKPWVCEVHYVYDEDLNLYFRSRPQSRHSEEIAANSSVAGNIVKQHGLGEKPRGVYFEGTAEELTEVDANHIAYKLYCERFSTNESILEDAKSENGHRFYKITTTKFYLFDAVESTPSQKYEWIKS